MKEMDNSLPIAHDNGGRRCGLERRQVTYTIHIPERRSEIDRRSGFDRRKGDGSKRPVGNEKRGQSFD